ncbi:hypothetical protein GGR58DRAFT_503414 [Xylaria digitata]|nr:hypothetical protein GGR58DRAFT_503414 [Xylaria digitata]
MADADYFLDLPSSPDPLADDVPSSARPATRRITKSQQDTTSFYLPQNSPRRQSRALSPRKRTFQLDVGDERSPQRIRVTVEAEEASKHATINRKLFPPAPSPTKSPRRREAITTTTVPLNDEPGPLDGDVSTPRKRGRQRRTSNGTPMPRGRKRAGTPIQRKSKQARREDEPSSEVGALDDASIDMRGDGGEETPKPKTRTRRTPRKPPRNTPVPSSQVSSSTTGRKRGRPRKVPVPEEPTVLMGTKPQTNRVASASPPASESNIQNGPNSLLKTRRNGESNGRDDDNANSIPNSLRQSNNTTRLVHDTSPQGPTTIERSSASPTSSHQELTGNDDFIMNEDYQAVEPQSDLESTEDEDGITHHGQDTIADASDFSMIAVESLPSFQASFQASFRNDTGKSASDQHEMGEETSRIINETLDSLRRSLSTEAESSSHAAENQNDLRRVQGQDEGKDETQTQLTMTTNHDSGRGFLSSPRRPKQMPLSRQVFVGRGQVDDSFSTIPDSILHVATPGRLPMQATAGGREYQGREDDPHEDSFSEIPEAILEAATPRPVRRVETSAHESPGGNEATYQTTRPTGRRSSPDYGLNRLPTPEETSSSNDGSRKAREEDTGAEPEPEPQDEPDLARRPDISSSPPIGTRPRALDFGYSNLQHELNAVHERLSPSPQRQLSSKNAPSQLQSLEAPLPSARPSLSPIVRVGRTLQNVMSDNSSPEDREGNLGSPFRGSASSDYIHQSIVAGSSSPSLRKRRVSGQSQLSAGPPARLEQNFRSNLERNFGRISQNSREAEDPFAPENITRTGPMRYSTRQQPSDSILSVHPPSMTASTKIDPPSANEEMSRATQDNSSPWTNRRQPSFQAASSDSPSTVGRHTASVTQVATADDTYSHPRQERSLRDEPMQDMDGNSSNRFEEDIDDGDDYDVDIWDIEASRTSPGKPELPRTTLKVSKPDVPSSRRSKVPSPWRRNNRRLIYKDNIASSSQIEIEESSQSEVEQYPPVRSRQRPPVSQTQQSTRRRSPDQVPGQKGSMQEDLHRLENTASPNPSNYSFGEYAGLADSEEPEDVVENEEPAAPEQPQGPSDLTHEDHEEHDRYEDHEEHGEHDEHVEPEAPDMPKVPEASIDVSEYSMVTRQAKQTPKEPKKRKSGLFGGFDILSFFSSPAVLPTSQPSGSNPPEPVNKPAILQSTLDDRELKEPPRALWSTGLFPSILQKETRASSERRTDLSSPGLALRSTDTVADTYEPSTLTSPSPARSLSVSAVPSTPEHQNFPPIQQKRNFTPMPGQSRGLLFAPSEASSAPRGEDNNDLQEYSDEQESSALTETSEYERVPPREKPSRWDRHLSPTKSCFRSPQKPTTPGRLVAFSNSALSPLAQAQARNTLHNSTSARNTMPQGRSIRPAFEGKENQPHPHTQQIKNANNNYLDENVPKFATGSRGNQQSLAIAPAALTTKSAALSQTTWSRQHWLRLDDMLQLRRHDPIHFQQACALPPRDQRHSFALLGKEVVAQDARLLLEPWHLEVVEAFKFEVGGWDETTLAKRLFALIIGEERRRAGLVP